MVGCTVNVKVPEAATVKQLRIVILVKCLENRHLQQVEDAVVSLSATERYEKLKSEIIRKLADSDSTRMRKLLESEEMGERKPSQFYQYLGKLTRHVASPVGVFEASTGKFDQDEEIY